MNRDIPFGQPDFGSPERNDWLQRLYLGVQDWLQLPFPKSNTDVLTGNPATSRRCEWKPGSGGGSDCCESLQAQIDVLAAQIALLGGGGVPDPELDPRYSNEGGEGDRQSGITASSTVGLFPAGPGDLAYRLINGMAGYENYFNAVGDLSEHWIVFDFAVPVYIIEAKWYQGTTTGDNGTWQWQGSVNGTTWTNIGSTFVLDTSGNVPATGKPDFQYLTTLAANAFLWRYYRMRGVSGSFSSSNYVYDIEFKIDR